MNKKIYGLHTKQTQQTATFSIDWFDLETETIVEHFLTCEFELNASNECEGTIENLIVYDEQGNEVTLPDDFESELIDKIDLQIDWNLAWFDKQIKYADYLYDSLKEDGF